MILGGLGYLAYRFRWFQSAHEAMRGKWAGFWLWVLAILTLGYWAPTAIGYSRKQTGQPVNMGQVAILNLFGVTLILWVAALVFAFAKPTQTVLAYPAPPAPDYRRHS